MKPMDHCNLCLSQVTDAVACPEAHVFCRECCYADLLAQKAGIERQKAELDAWEREDERKRFEAREKARERVRANFERGMGLGGRVRIGAPKSDGVNGAEKDGEKDLEAEVERLAREAEDAALAAIEAEESDGRKAKIAAFWLPDNTPEAPLGPLKAVKLQTLCHVGQAHPISRKSLLPVVFSYPSSKAPSSSSGSSSESKPGCPSCLREVNNATGAMLLTSSKVEKAEEKADGEEPKKKKKKKDAKEKREAICGHVICNACCERAQKGGNTCPVCEASIERAIPLGKEGECGPVRSDRRRPELAGKTKLCQPCRSDS
jgi:nitric oxide synthase-interacting protein